MGGADDDAIRALFERAAADAKAWGLARVRFYKLVALRPLQRSKLALALIGVALVLVPGAFGALLIGAVLALAPITGALGAGVIVFLGTLAIVGLLGWIAARKLRTAFDFADIQRIEAQP